ncbi:MAG: polyprenyl synthetase family protein [Acidaminococcus sp.]|nr:polyprenyl synthetase family protein [Acidaminococcus sp.]MCI2099403.1 polyprenyl synthetase family protein [Acidaminococcus sp.]MCI2113763.1 polyprenyl synthetase family protein [Acidaminococcus sp.]MCI2115663.1 polyprenyl synthetase family protein [Acidaminococcus sp.]
MDLKAYLKERGALVNQFLDETIGKGSISPVDEAMKYSVMAGGKRLRPILLMASADIVGADGTKFINVAAGLEMIHTYSLIHDDLPEMDNDDYRRGRLTNHKVFGHAMAVLAGDGLQSQAFEVMLEQKGVAPEKLVEVVHLVAHCAGPFGMDGGQALDITSEGKKLTLAQMKQLHEAKTGALFIASIRGGAILGGGTPEEIETLTKFARLFGLAFQITDDILDVEGDEAVMGKKAGMDQLMNKSTYVTLFSLEKAKEMAKETLEEARKTLAPFGTRAEVLTAITEHLYNRKK